MGLSYHDEPSMEETVESLCFATQNEDLISETEDRVDISGKERGNCDDIQVVDRWSTSNIEVSL